MDALQRHLRFAFRQFVRNPIFTGAVVLTLGLGIGANTAVFTVVNALLLRSLPFPDSKKLVTVVSTNVDASGRMEEYGVSLSDYVDWIERNLSFRGLAAMEPFEIGLTGFGDPEQIDAGRVSSNFFSVFAVPPRLGRFFLPDEAIKSPQVAVLSYGFWKRVLGEKKNVIGQSIILDGAPYEIVGIAPKDFFYFAPVELWIPLNPGKDRSQRVRTRNLAIVGRLRSDISVDLVSGEMSRIASQLAREFPETNSGWGAKVLTLREQMQREIGPGIIALMIAVVFVLLIICANVSTLMLAQMVERESEMNLRIALGAERRDLFLQFLVENLVLSMMGGILGLLLSYCLLRPMVSLSPVLASAQSYVHVLTDIAPDIRVLCYAFGMSTLIGVVFGFLISWKSGRSCSVNPNQRGRGSFGGVRNSKMLKSLVFAEILIAFVLLTAGIQSVQSFWKLQKTNPGFTPANVVIAKMTLPANRYEPAARIALVDSAREKISSLPGVSSVSITTRTPLNEFAITTFCELEGRPLLNPAESIAVNFRRISPDYFRTLQIRFLEGRDFTSQDKEGIPVAVISREMARRYWPGTSALGKRIRRTSPLDNVWRTVVGVVEDVKDGSLSADAASTMYIPYAQNSFPTFHLSVRYQPGMAPPVDGIRNAIQELDKSLPVYDIGTMEELFSQSLSRPRFLSFLLVSFAALGFLIDRFPFGVSDGHARDRNHESFI